MSFCQVPSTPVHFPKSGEGRGGRERGGAISGEMGGGSDGGGRDRHCRAMKVKGGL